MLVENYAHGEPQNDITAEAKPQSLEDVSAELSVLAEKQRKILENTKAQKEKSKATKNKAAQIKAVLQYKLENGGHSEEVNAHIQNAIDSCDACINAGEYEHIAIADHLQAAHGHVHKADQKHKGTACHCHHGHHCEKPEIVGHGAELSAEHEHHH